MKTQKRVERRFFLPTEEYQRLVNQINIFGYLHRYYFDQPVTETIYFTLGDSENSLYADLYVRVRRYVRHLSEVVVLDDSLAYLEIKDKKGESCVSFKKRHLVTGKQAVEILFKLQDRSTEILPLDCPSLHPLVGTQVERLHWQAGDLRVTVDPETHFFGFTNTDMYRGYRMGSLGEIKIEFKYNNRLSLFGSRVEGMIFADLDFYPEPSPDYMERRIRECYVQWICAQSSK